MGGGGGEEEKIHSFFFFFMMDFIHSRSAINKNSHHINTINQHCITGAAANNEMN